MPLRDLIAQLQELEKQGCDRAFVGCSGKIVIGADRNCNGDVIITTMRMKKP